MIFENLDVSIDKSFNFVFKGEPKSIYDYYFAIPTLHGPCTM